MIKKFNEYIKESLLDKLKGPSKEELRKSYGYDKTFDTPEEFFLDAIDGITTISPNKYHNDINYYEKNDNVLFQYFIITNIFYVSFNKIWVILIHIFNMKEWEARKFIKEMVEKYLNLKDVKIVVADSFMENRWIDDIK